MKPDAWLPPERQRWGKLGLTGWEWDKRCWSSRDSGDEEPHEASRGSLFANGKS